MARPSKDKPTYSRGGLHYFVIHAHRGCRGAYIGCWINFRLHEGALLLAKHYIRAAGWRISSITEHRWLDGLSEVSVESKRYFREARKDGASFVFHRYIKRRAK